MAVTSRDLMSELEIKNVKTLTRWYQHGVIPEPTIELHPGGIGRIACWPDWVLSHCRIVKTLTSEGKTLQQIAEYFGDDWAEIARRYKKYNFADVYRQTEFDHSVFALYDEVSDDLVDLLGEIRELLLLTAFPAMADGVLKNAVDLIRDGYNAVLVVTAKKVVVTTDFLVGLHLSDHISSHEAFVVVPLFSRIKRHLPTENLPASPAIRPVSYVHRQTGDGQEEEVIKYAGEWKFTSRRNKPKSKQRKK